MTGTSNDALRWHLHIAILANMRSSPGPVTEEEYDLCEDDIGEILEGPY